MNKQGEPSKYYDVSNIVDTGGFFYYSMYYDGVPGKQLIADIAEVYNVSTEAATAAFKEILRQWRYNNEFKRD